jgi:lipopolysaccharide biosynthesis regulator YciM
MRRVETSNSLLQLGNVSYVSGNVDRAISLHEDAIKIRKDLLGSEHLSVALSLNKLANDYIVKCDYKKAMGLQNTAL